MRLYPLREAFLRMRARKDDQIEREIQQRLAEMAKRVRYEDMALQHLRRNVSYRMFVDRYCWRGATEPLVTPIVADYLRDWYEK